MELFKLKKIRVLWTLLAAGLITGIFFFWGNSSELSWKTKVSVVGPIDQGVAATGNINPKNTVEVGTQISGIIEGVFVDYNDTVQVGTLLAIVDSSIIDANIEQLEANLSAAEAVFKAINIKPMLPEGSQDLLEKDKRSLNSVASIESIKNLILSNRRFN